MLVTRLRWLNRKAKLFIPLPLVIHHERAMQQAECMMMTLNDAENRKLNRGFHQCTIKERSLMGQEEVDMREVVEQQKAVEEESRRCKTAEEVAERKATEDVKTKPLKAQLMQKAAEEVG